MSLTALAKKAKCKLTVCAQDESVNDRWMQVCALGAGGLGAGGTPRGSRGTRPRLHRLGPHPAGHPSSAGEELRASQGPRRRGRLRKATLLTFKRPASRVTEMTSFLLENAQTTSGN